MAEQTGILKKLLDIQTDLKAPKGQYNSFGKYKYRSAEDILEAVKPLCKKHGAVLILTDEIITIGDQDHKKTEESVFTGNRYYVKASATLASVDGGEVCVCAYAREDYDKKGMDGSQITGAASSYARKYALNGLFCIDDTKDADTDEHANNRNNRPAPTPTVNVTTGGKRNAPKQEEPADPGDYVVQAPGKSYNNKTLRDLDATQKGKELLNAILDTQQQEGTPGHDLQKAIVRFYSEKSA